MKPGTHSRKMTDIQCMAIKASKDDRAFQILDQKLLPQTKKWITVSNTDEAYEAIRSMQVRGAPMIAVVGIFGCASDVINRTHELEAARLDPLCVTKYTWKNDTFGTSNSFEEASEADLVKYLTDYAVSALKHVTKSRPTAVNLGNDVEEALAMIEKSREPWQQIGNQLLDFAFDKMTNYQHADTEIGANGVEWTRKQFGNDPISVITICNTGSLASPGIGTAFGIVTCLHAAGLLKHVYILETRPYNQGSRLTAFEAMEKELPATLMTDNMAAAIMQKDKCLKLAIVGADRITLHGDVANKIGTYQLAVLSRVHGLKFVVAAPESTIDFRNKDFSTVTIEERDSDEVTKINGQQIADPRIKAWNPSFDVTPPKYIDAIVTEKRVCAPADIPNVN